MAEEPGRVEWLRQLADNHLIIGELHAGQDRTAAAVESFSSSIEVLLRIVSITGDDPVPRNKVSWHRVLLGDVFATRQELDRAREQWTLAVEWMQPITANSDVLQYLDTHAQALLRLGRLEESRPLVEKLLAEGWDDADFLELVRRSGLDVTLP